MVIIGCLFILAASYARVRYAQDIVGTPPSLAQESLTVDRGDITLTVSASAPIRANQDLPLVFLSQGRVQVVNVVEGQRVLKGQQIAALDTRAQQTALENTRIALDGARIALKALVANPRPEDVRSAQAALDAAKAQLGAAGVGGYDPTQVKLAQINVEIAKNQLWQSQLQGKIAQQSGVSPDVLNQINSLIAPLPEEVRNQIGGAINNLFSSLSGAAGLPSASQIQTGLQAQELNVKIAQSQLAQTQNARPNGANIAQAQAAVVQAQSALERLYDGADPKAIQVAQAQVDAAQAALDLTEYSLSRGVLTAPFDGVVTRLNLTVGENAPLDKPALVLVDDSGYYLEIGVDEIDIPKVAVGQKVSLSFDALPGDLISGTVDRVATSSLELSGVVTYPVRIAISSNSRLRAGLSTTATITVSQIKDVVRVRNRFVRLDRKSGKAFVTLQSPDGKFSEVQVTLGLRNETFTEIKSGLTVGDVIVILPRESNLLGF
jgi:HlyD family secretion protein